MPRLILFDIDGTLLGSRNGLGGQAFARVLRERFGRSANLRLEQTAGKTDPEIAENLLRALGMAEEEIGSVLDSILVAYLEVLRNTYCAANGAFMYPGVQALLEALTGVRDTVLGLLTGNVEAGARIKLGAFGLNRYFRCGAFGSDHKARAELPAIARQRATTLTGWDFQGKDIVIVGDTVHDIQCGKPLGVRTIGVVTHPPFRKDMAAAEPDYLLDDFADTESVVQAMLE